MAVVAVQLDIVPTSNYLAVVVETIVVVGVHAIDQHWELPGVLE